ncbi:MAG TPA: hypothetical protein VFM34_03055 [Moraxellaceae bacterium]|nr:hypothetical protein [Moraxellaceae bacterium]
MEAVMVAMAILMWMWGAASLQVVQRALPVRIPGRGAWLGLLIALGGGVLVALLHLALPASLLSQGWSRETLSATQQWTTVAVMVIAIAGLVRGVRHLDPAAAPRRLAPAAAASAAAASAAASATAPGSRPRASSKQKSSPAKRRP